MLHYSCPGGICLLGFFPYIIFYLGSSWIADPSQWPMGKYLYQNLIKKQIKKRPTQYVPIVRDALVVNVGNMLQRWTNGIFKSPIHRAINFSNQPRHVSFLLFILKVFFILHNYRHVIMIILK